MRKPVIGILMRSELERATEKPMHYVFDSVRKAVILSGGIPLLICPPKVIDYFTTRNRDFPEFSEEDKDMLRYYIKCCDGILIPGGTKFTKYDIEIVDMAVKKDMPVLGICLGMQILASYKRTVEENIIPIESEINHRQVDIKYAHSVNIKENSLLYKIIGKEKIDVNSYHKMQALNNPLYEVVATAPDGVIEAIEMKDKNFIIGVQWHPEKGLFESDNTSEKIFNAFINESLRYKKNKKGEIVKL